jgi:hypothetical protein
MKLVQVRKCDGKCCEEKPRFPNKHHSHCIFWDGHCKLMTGEEKIPQGESPIWPGRSSEEVFQETCKEWPQNSHEGKDTGGCCWQWVADGD